MSALALPPAPRLQVVRGLKGDQEEQVPAEATASPFGPLSTGLVRPRPRLRLVTPPEGLPEVEAGSGQQSARPRLVVVKSDEGRSGSGENAEALRFEAASMTVPSIVSGSAQQAALSRGVAASQRTQRPAAHHSTRRSAGRSDAARLERPRAEVRAQAQAATGLWALPVAVRRVIAVIGLIVVVACGVAGGLAVSAVMSEPQAGGSVTVEAGQSLWDIARQTGTADVSRTVSDIAQLNHLKDSTVQAGQVLILPAH